MTTLMLLVVKLAGTMTPLPCGLEDEAPDSSGSQNSFWNDVRAYDRAF
jgi:hypothetical protein